MACRLLLRKIISHRCFLPLGGVQQCAIKSTVKWPLVHIGRTIASGGSASDDTGSSSTVMEISGLRVEKNGRCVVIRMERGENRLNREFVRAMNQALDAAESYEDAIAVITTGKDKFYSNGLDLDEMGSLSESENVDSFNDIQKLFGRLLAFPMLTIAAINGHVYAAGALFATVQDYRVMRTGRGWFCLPEIFIKRNFSPGLFEILKARLPQPALHRAAVLGQRYTAEEAMEAKLIDEVCDLADLEKRALLAADGLAGGEPGLDRKTLATIKRGLYRDAYTALNKPVGKVYTNELVHKS